MDIYQFIFSDEKGWRLKRHLAFWIFFSLHIFLFRYYVPDLKYLGYGSTYLLRFQNLMLFLPVSVFYAYFALYYLLPNYILKEKYGQLSLIVIFSCVLFVLISYQVSKFFDIRLSFDLPFSRNTIVRQFDFTVSNGLVYPLTVTGFAIAIKMAKKFYLKQKENTILTGQKIKAEVELMKSQVHPRFLFHSLNSIFYDMQHGSKYAPDMLLKLSDLLSYILYESDERLVPLEKELAMLNKYVELEKLSRNNLLEVNYGNSLNTDEKFIAPLTLLQAAEYLFEKTKMDSDKKLSLTINILMKEDKLWNVMSLNGYNGLNNNPESESEEQIEQLKKRLLSVYGARQHIEIAKTEKSISISMSVVLDNVTSDIS